MLNFEGESNSLRLHHQRLNSKRVKNLLENFKNKIEEDDSLDFSHNLIGHDDSNDDDVDGDSNDDPSDDASNGKVATWTEKLFERTWKISKSIKGISFTDNRIKCINVCPIIRLEHLKELDLSHNRLKFINDELFMWLPHLKRLKLEGNQLTLLPSSIILLSSLETLIIGTDLGGNKIEKFPLGMENLTQMSVLSCTGNLLKEFPKFTINWAHLEILKLNKNKISKFPSSLDLSACRELTELDIEENKIDRLTGRVCWPNSLKVLNFSANSVKIISKSFTCDLSSDCVLLLAGNSCIQEQHPLKKAPPSTVSRRAFEKSLTLLELAARINAPFEPSPSLPTSSSPLTPPLCAYLKVPPEVCANCPMRMRQACARIVTPSNIFGHENVPVEQPVCSLACLSLLSIHSDPQGFLSITPFNDLDTDDEGEGGR